MESDWNNTLNAETGKLPPLEGLFQALAHEGRSVLMVSDDEALLDTCGQNVMRKLRQNPDIEVVAMFDMDREILLQRFGRHVESLSVDQALQAADASLTQQVWVQHIHNSEELDQAKLLIRLSGDFPASGVKLLLLASNLCANNLIHHGQAKKLLVWYTPVMRTWGATTASTEVKPLAASVAVASHSLDDTVATMPEDFSFTNPTPRAARKDRSQRWVAQLLLGVFVLVSVVVLSFNQWQSGQIGDEVQTPTAEQEAVEPMAAVVASKDAAAKESLLPPLLTLIEPEFNLAPNPKTLVEYPTASALPGVDWVRQLDANGWVVQHVALDNLNEIQAWQAQYPALSRAQSVPLLRPNGQQYWVLVSGPFASVNLANAFAQATGVPKDYWPRGTGSLKANLDNRL